MQTIMGIGPGIKPPFWLNGSSMLRAENAEIARNRRSTVREWCCKCTTMAGAVSFGAANFRFAEAEQYCKKMTESNHPFTSHEVAHASQRPSKPKETNQFDDGIAYNLVSLIDRLRRKAGVRRGSPPGAQSTTDQRRET